MRRGLAARAAALLAAAAFTGCGAQETGATSGARLRMAAAEAAPLHVEVEGLTHGGPCVGVGTEGVTYYCNGDTSYGPVAIPQAGTYRITVLGMSTEPTDAAIAVYLGGVKAGTLTFAGTDLTAPSLTFAVATAGTQELKLLLETDTGVDDTIVDWIELALEGAAPPPPPPPPPPESPDLAQLGFEGSQFATWNGAGAYNYDDEWTVTGGSQAISFAQDTATFKAGAASLRITGTMLLNRFGSDYISAARVFLSPDRATVDFSRQAITVSFYLASGTAENVQVILNDSSYQPCQSPYLSLPGAGRWVTVTFDPNDVAKRGYTSPSFDVTRVAFVEVRLSSYGLAAPTPVVWNVDGIAWASTKPPPPPPVLPTVGAVESGVYRNLFREWNPELTDADVQAKLDLYWDSMFASTDDNRRVYFPAGANANGPMAYVYDAGNGDVRSEGMSYGMMIAVQMGKKAEFDALWNFAKTHMQHPSGARAGYFAWQVRPDGTKLDPNSATDGEEYFATALFMASGRWGNAGGIYNYAAEANAILDVMLHKEDMNGGVVEGITNAFDRTEKQPVFVPYMDAASFSDPSYHLPAFYELWGRWAAGWNGHRAADREFWLDAAATSRTYFQLAAHPTTGLTPDYAHFDGTPNPWNDHGDFRFDAWRTAMNWAVDHAWWAKDPAAVSRTDTLQAFFTAQGRYVNQYTLDGTPLSESGSQGLVAMNGVASLAASQSQAWDYVSALWNLSPPTGQWRYYDGMLSFLAVLHASGQFRIYEPQALPVVAPARPKKVDADLSGANVKVTWRDESSNEWSFVVLRKAGIFGPVEIVARLGTDVTSWTDTSVRRKTLYTYWIVATNPAGHSKPSLPALVITRK